MASCNCCDCYTVQSTLVLKLMKNPTLVIESDYDQEETGPLRTRVETIQIIKRK